METMAIIAEVQVRKEQAVARREAAMHLQQDIKLSLGQTQSVPNMLMTAPLAINLLGQIKLLAFTDHALRIRLTEPNGGFKYLKRKSLSSAMIQIVDQAAESFDCAEKVMRRIRMQTNVMFGRTGHVQTILMCLQDPRIAKRDLLSSMAKFREDMEKCAMWAKEAEDEFNALVKCAGEVNLAVADEITNTTEQEERLRIDQGRAEAQRQIETNALAVLEARTVDAESEFREARALYQKAGAKGEGSAVAAALAVGIGSSITGLLNATIGVFKVAPMLANEAVRLIGGLGTTDSKKQEGPAVIGLDPALLAAEEIETQLLYLNAQMGKDLATIVAEDSSLIQIYVKRFNDLKTGLGEAQSNHTLKARAILTEAIDLVNVMLAQGQESTNTSQWEKKTSHWRKIMSSLLDRATKLRSYAAAQPGQGFGGSLGSSSSLQTADPNSSTYDQILHHRHQKLLITRSAMNDARSNMNRTADMQLQAQTKIVEIARQMREVQHKQDVATETKQVLRKSLDVLVAMQQQVRQLTGFFNALTNIINIVCKGHAEQYLRAIDAGITGQGDHFAIAYSEQQLQVIRDTVFTLRGHFGFVVHSADMYQEVANAHINPCIRMAATLPLSANPSEQEEAKRALEEMTSASSEAIKLLAERETEKYHKDLENRVEEIERELSSLTFPPPSENDENLESIKTGIKECSDEIVGDAAEINELFEEISEDL